MRSARITVNAELCDLAREYGQSCSPPLSLTAACEALMRCGYAALRIDEGLARERERQDAFFRSAGVQR